jgi:hypothetical protein
MRWDDENFRRIVAERAAAIGKSLPEVARAAKVGVEYFRKSPAHGRNTAQIFKIAEILRADPAELMGLRSAELPDQELAVAVSLAVSIYCAMKNHHDDEIPTVVAKIIKVVRQEFAVNNHPPADAAKPEDRPAPPASPERARPPQPS